jgi:dCTP deaminase
LILTDREIQIAIETGAIKIEPVPKPEMYSSTSVDLLLHPEITIFKPPNEGQGINVVLDPTHPAFHPERSLAPYNEKVAIGDGGYDLEPNRLVLGWTMEKVDLNIRSKLAARVEGKSSLARIGLGIHITAPTIHAGFGLLQIRLEIINHGYVPIKLKSGMKICQLIFEQTLGTPVKGYSGQFLGQGAA